MKMEKLNVFSSDLSLELSGNVLNILELDFTECQECQKNNVLNCVDYLIQLFEEEGVTGDLLDEIETIGDRYIVNLYNGADHNEAYYIAMKDLQRAYRDTLTLLAEIIIDDDKEKITECESLLQRYPDDKKMNYLCGNLIALYNDEVKKLNRALSQLERAI